MALFVSVLEVLGFVNANLEAKNWQNEAGISKEILILMKRYLFFLNALLTVFLMAISFSPILCK